MLKNQRANSVADIAAALQLVVGGVPVVGKSEEDGKVAEKKAKQLEGQAAIEPHTGEPKVVVKWTDILDAEFAASWPDTVVHDELESTRNNRRARVLQKEIEPEDSSVDAVDLPKDESGKAIL